MTHFGGVTRDQENQGRRDDYFVIASASASPPGRAFILNCSPGVTRAKNGHALPPATNELLPLRGGRQRGVGTAHARRTEVRVEALRAMILSARLKPCP